LVTCVSPGTGTNSAAPPSGLQTVMPPLSSVATQMFPFASSASESKRR
jgi:hypothetical protein